MIQRFRVRGKIEPAQKLAQIRSTAGLLREEESHFFFCCRNRLFVPGYEESQRRSHN